MRLRDLAVVGLATTCSGRRLRLRQLTPYDANSTEPADTIVEYSESPAVTTPSSPLPPSSYQSETSDAPIVAPVPYSSPQPPPSSYDSTTTTTSIYLQNPTVGPTASPTVYSSIKYSFAPSPVGSGTAPSGYSSPSDNTAPPTYRPTGTTTLPPHSYTGNATNATCSGATLNVLDASLDWWYTLTLYHAVSTFSVQFNRNDSSTGWTALPATTTFNAESALATASDCSSSKIWVPSANASLYDVDCTAGGSPVAAETTVITQTAYKDPPSKTGNGSLPQLVVTPKPASIRVADAEQTPYAQGTPFVFFSAYEIVTKSVTTFGNGSAGCAEATQTYTMDQAFSFEYTGEDVNGSLLVNEGVIGDVNPALLGLVGQDTAVAGSWVAEPTVVLLMQEVFVAEAALAATVEPTASFLDTPAPTKPPYVTLAPTGPDGPPKITQSPRVEVSATKLQLPTGAGDDNRPTGVGPVEQTQGGGSNNGGGQPDGENAGNNGGRPPQTNVGGLIDAINSAVQQPPKPTNALDVLSQAEATFPGSNPTANAIINGMGGPAESGGGGGSPQAVEDNLPGGGGNGGQNGGGSNGGGSDEGGSRAITVGGAVITPNAQNEFDLPSGATLRPGGTAVVDGTTLSLDSEASAVVVNGVTQNLASPTGGAGAGAASNIPLITNGRAIITPNAATEYSIAPGATLTPGGQVVVDGRTMSLDSAGTALVVDGVTRNVGGADAAGAITVGSAVITPNAASGYVIAPGTTLTPGGSVVVDGTTFSLDSSATELVVNGETQDIASPAEATMAPILTIAGHTYHAINGGTTYVIDGETLTMGEEETVTVDGTAYQISLAPSATRLIVETEDANGQVTATSTSTLFPQQGSGSGASATGSGSGGPEEQTTNTAPISTLLPFSGLCLAFGSLFLAVWL